MGKIVLFLSLLYVYAEADSVEKNCLLCHRQQQIPSQLIYKRYLLKYSTEQRMEKAIFSYLKNPDKKDSIMPPAFFLKFPMKIALDLEDKELHESIHAFLKKYDLQKKLMLEEEK